MHQQNHCSRRPINGLYKPEETDLNDMSELSEISVENTMNDKITQSIQDIDTRMATLETQFRLFQSSQSIPSAMYNDTIEHELMSMEKQQNTKNILVSSVRNTPALAAAVAAANPPSFDLCNNLDDNSDTEENEVVNIESKEADTDVEIDAEIDVEDVSVEEEILKKITIKGVVYYIDPDDAIYHETEDGYEQVGTYDSKTDTINPLIGETLEEEEKKDEDDDEVMGEVEEVEEVEEDEEAIEVEEFVYKGQTYQRDINNNVYLDGDQVGTWNGKKILSI
jgi:hypothetical protein